ncbi:MAG TPA: Spx/MgsR family RNA polymerase-binding regulatory protein [Rhodocyclaceae bacterium]|nr:Spx/MgsR family RNA polymerase-binding regulatory protein [Rhodocyclaceae bacterium]
MITIYGIKNCDTMKKTFVWCRENKLDYTFHDYRKDGVPQQKLRAWCAVRPYLSLINTRGPTWRKLSAERQAVDTLDDAIALMTEYPALIRRPIIEKPDADIAIGFDPAQLDSLLPLHP